MHEFSKHRVGGSVPPGPKYINIFGGPGCGKTTTAWKIAATLSELGYVVEVIPEFAKSLTWNNSKGVLSDQLFVFATQSHPLEMLRNSKLDFVIVDSPLPTSLAYANENFYKHFEPLVIEVFKSYDNMNYVMKRETPYVPIGRSQTAAEAGQKDVVIRQILAKHELEYTSLGLGQRDQIILEAIMARDPSVPVPELPTDISAPIREALNRQSLLRKAPLLRSLR